MFRVRNMFFFCEPVFEWASVLNRLLTASPPVALRAGSASLTRFQLGRLGMTFLKCAIMALTVALLFSGAASAQTTPKKCAVSYEACVAKSMQDGWTKRQASHYCANERPCVKN